jgi:hypothetical protein
MRDESKTAKPLDSRHFRQNENHLPTQSFVSIDGRFYGGEVRQNINTLSQDI